MTRSFHYRMERKDMKKKQNIRRILQILMVTAVMAAALCITASAEDASGLGAKMNTIYQLVMSVVQGIGLILIAFGLMDFGPGISQHDSAQQLQGLKKMGGGAAMLLGPQSIQLLS